MRWRFHPDLPPVLHARNCAVEARQHIMLRETTEVDVRRAELQAPHAHRRLRRAKVRAQAGPSASVGTSDVPAR